MKIFIVLLVVLIFCSIVWAHVPEGRVYHVFQWPSGYEPKIDGDLSEWDIVPTRYILSGKNDTKNVWLTAALEYESTQKYNYETGNFGIDKVIAGWSESKNRLYFAAKIFDNVHFIGRPPLDSPDKFFVGDDDVIYPDSDSFWIFVDSDHSGGEYQVFSPTFKRGRSQDEIRRLVGAQAQGYIICVPAPDDYPVYFASYAFWAWKSPWTEIGWKIKGDTTFYEVAITPFDDLNYAGSEESRIHDLTEGQIVGMAYQFIDFDDPVGGSLWSTGSNEVFTAGGADTGFCDFMLEPVERELFINTSVEPSTWGRIKALFLNFNR